MGRKKPLSEKFSERSIKHYLERQDEFEYEDFFNQEMEFYNSPDLKTKTKVPAFQLKRQLRLKVPNNIYKWLRDSGNKDLIPAYDKYVRSQSRLRNELSSALAKALNMSIEREHWVPAAGAEEDIEEAGINPKTGRIKLTPTRSANLRGANTEGGPGSGPWNRRIGSKRAFALSALQQLNQPVNWMESVTNFVARRPDLNPDRTTSEIGKGRKIDRTLRDTDFLKLQQGLVSADQLEIEGFRDEDLRRSGIQNPTNFRNLFTRLVTGITNQDMVKSAQDRTPGKDRWSVIWKGRDKGVSQKDYDRIQQAKLPLTEKFTKLPRGEPPNIKPVVNPKVNSRKNSLLNQLVKLYPANSPVGGFPGKNQFNVNPAQTEAGTRLGGDGSTLVNTGPRLRTKLFNPNKTRNRRLMINPITSEVGDIHDNVDAMPPLYSYEDGIGLGTGFETHDSDPLGLLRTVPLGRV
tara:strand:+ start:422 stop:1807 length:1386 start_codon:yes stop_codon:yes gene_type:complete